MQSIAAIEYIKNNIKHPFWMFSIILILCTLFIFSGLQASLLFKAFILTAIISIVIAFFYNRLIGVMIVLFFMNFENLHDVYKSIIGNYQHNIVTTLEERKEAEYNHMEYKFIKDIVTRFTSTNFFPTLYYPNYDFGVRALLPGYRNQISTEMIGIMDLDATMLNVSGLDCKQTNLNDSSKLSCDLKEHPEGAYTISGIHFESEFSPQENYEIIVMNNELVLSSFSFSMSDIFNTTKRPNLLKFPAQSIMLPNYNKSVFTYKTITEQDMLNGNTLEIIVKGKSVPGFSLSGHRKRVPGHIILEWDTYDAGSYIAITKSALSTDRTILDMDTEKAIYELTTSSNL